MTLLSAPREVFYRAFKQPFDCRTIFAHSGKMEALVNAKIHLEANGAVVAAEGSEDFIAGVIDRWSYLLAEQVSTPPSVEAKRTRAEKSAESPEHSYDSVFARHNDKLKIIAHMPGNSKAEATRNTALVFLFGEFIAGKDEVSAEQIKAACLDQGCYDNKNFATHLRSLKPKVVMDPKPGGDYTVKLTAPGRKFAKELVEQLNG